MYFERPDLVDTGLKTMCIPPTHRAVLARPLLLWPPAAACLQASAATRNLSGGGTEMMCLKDKHQASCDLQCTVPAH